LKKNLKNLLVYYFLVDRAVIEEMLYDLKRVGKAVLTPIYRVIYYFGIIGRVAGRKYRSGYYDEINVIGSILAARIFGMIEGTLYHVLLNLDYYNNLLSSYFPHSAAEIYPEVGGISLYLPLVVGADRLIHAWYEFEKKKIYW
jgi:hypothetical protein